MVLIIPFIALSELFIAVLFPAFISSMLEIDISDNFLVHIDVTVLFCVLITTYLARILLTKKIYWLIQNSRTRLSSQYLNNLLASDYEYLRNYDMSKLNTVGVHVVDLITTNLVTPLYNLVSGVVLIVIFSSYLLMQFTSQYLFFLATIVPIVFLLAMFLKIKQKIHSLVIRESIFKRESLLKTISENIVSVVFYKKAHNILSSFEENVGVMSDRSHSVAFLTFIVRPIIEIVLLIIVFSLILTDFNVKENSEFLILFSFLLFRAVPPLSLMVSSMGLLKIGVDNYDVYKDEINKLGEAKDDSEINEISLHESDELFVFRSDRMFSDLVFQIDQSALIKGESGVGKSTLFFKLLKLLPLRQGETLSIASSRSKYLEHSFLIPQNGLLILNSLASTFDYYNITSYCREDLNYLVREFNLNITNILEYDLGYYGSKLSGGQKQKLSIIVALLSGKDILFMDESFSAINQEAVRKIIKEIYRRKKIFLGIFHSNEFDDLVKNIVQLKLKECEN